MIRNIGDNIADLAFQNVAKQIQSMCADVRIGSETGKLSGAYMEFIYQAVLGYVFLLHRVPKIFVTDHNSPG